MAMKGYFTLPKFLELEPHRLMHLSVIHRKPFSGVAQSPKATEYTDFIPVEG